MPDLLLDEDVAISIGRKLEGRGIKIERHEKSKSDREVLMYSVELDVPVLTRNQGDFVSLDRQIRHRGVMIDKGMNRRNPNLVADTVSGILEDYSSGELENELIFVSNFYGLY